MDQRMEVLLAVVLMVLYKSWVELLSKMHLGNMIQELPFAKNKHALRLPQSWPGEAQKSKKSRNYPGSSSRSNPSNRKPLHCSYCDHDHDHHIRETCWKLNGYPPEHPRHASNRSNQGHTHFKCNHSHQSAVNNVKESPIMQEVPLMTNGLSDLQIQQILSIMQDHITSSSTLLVNGSKNTFLPLVAMLSGEQTLITSIGNLPLNSAITLKNVLGMPSFKDLTTKMMIGLGEQRDGLYYLVVLASEKPKPQTPCNSRFLPFTQFSGHLLHLFMASLIGPFVFL
ncbi:hypothetical protein Pint_14688 [Pistacia integerrima]|uniref:Uncharacterized protein n=1 Tax=Pistacia integerrima TaxID=434235 RepID=A0ACC0YA57_9ROSI|nr:hypothetical protein Pint_14688 [Pistacia integerrima]